MTGRHAVVLVAPRTGQCAACHARLRRRYSVKVGWGLRRTYAQALATAQAELAARLAGPLRHLRCEPQTIVSRFAAGEHRAALETAPARVIRKDNL